MVFLYLSALVLRNLGDFVTTNVLTQTPIQVVHIIFMVSIIYGAYFGLEVIARASEILFPITIMTFFITAFLLFKEVDFSKLLPILPDGWLSPVKGMYPMLGFPMSELVIMIFIFPFVIEQNKIKNYFILFTIIAAVLGSLIVTITISVLGVDITARSTFSVFELAKEIKVGEFFERVEVLVGIIWIMTIFVKLSISFYVANLASAQIFNLKSYRATLLPYGLFVVALSMLVYRNTAESYGFITGAYPIYSLFHSLFIPALLLLIAKFRKINQKD